jgi:hypothetical protein
MKIKLQKPTTQQPLFEDQNPFAEQEQDLSQDLLRVYYAYFDGWLIKKVGRRNTVHSLQLSKPKNYRKICFDGKTYSLSRQIYVYHYGTIPFGMYIDHIDGDRNNNRIENLRLAHPDQNQWNRKINDSYRSTDYKGCSINYQALRKGKPLKCPWLARIRFTSNYELRHTSQRWFKTKTEAEAFIHAELAVLEATRALVHREYTNHG